MTYPPPQQSGPFGSPRPPKKHTGLKIAGIAVSAVLGLTLAASALVGAVQSSDQPASAPTVVAQPDPSPQQKQVDTEPAGRKKTKPAPDPEPADEPNQAPAPEAAPDPEPAGEPDQAPAPEAAPTVSFYQYATDELNVRTAPSGSAEVVTVLPLGAEVGSTGTAENGYTEIIYEGATAWVSTEYLSNTPPDLHGPPETVTTDRTAYDVTMDLGAVMPCVFHEQPDGYYLSEECMIAIMPTYGASEQDAADIMAYEMGMRGYLWGGDWIVYTLFPEDASYAQSILGEGTVGTV